MTGESLINFVLNNNNASACAEYEYWCQKFFKYFVGYRPGLYWQLTWRYIGPFIMVIILFSSILFMILKNPTYGAWDAESVKYLESI